MILDKNGVADLLPQKFPFVMVDQMHEFSETSLVAGLNISDEMLFTEDQKFLEAGLIEHMAQSVALHTGYNYFLKNKKAPTGYIGSIKEIAIEKLPQVNDTIFSTITILQEFAGITLVDIVTTLNNVTIAKGQMKTILAK